MLTLAVHDRLHGRLAREVGFARLLDYTVGRDRVWIARGDESARHCIARFPKPERGARA
jgi:hypothetical protein